MPQRVTTEAARRALFDEAASLIDREYRADLTVEYVASQIWTSRRQLQRAFAEIAGTTFRSYVATVRMHKAAALLADGDPATVRQIARRVGYQQAAQFAKAFRRVHGVAPAEFRARARQAPPAPARAPVRQLAS